MLLQLRIENFRSFGPEVLFSMQAGSERKFDKTLVKLDRVTRKRWLRLSAIYGANASGKSNFVGALRFLQSKVVRNQVQLFDRSRLTFRLDPRLAESPVSIEVTVAIGQQILVYGISIADETIVKEWLCTVSGQAIFIREGEKLTLGTAFEAEGKFNRNFMEDFFFPSLPKTSLLISRAQEFNIPQFKPIYEWFDLELRIITPSQVLGNVTSAFHAFPHFLDHFSKKLCRFDTGISGLKMVEQELTPDFFAFEHGDRLYHELVSRFKNKDVHQVVVDTPQGEITVVKGKRGKLLTERLEFQSDNCDGKKVSFSIDELSDGTKRMVDFLPLILGLGGLDLVFVVDELDRSLHPNMTKMIIESVRRSMENGGHSQLIFTTHEDRIFQSELFRKDELWLVEKDSFGRSTLSSLGEFKKVRSDLDWNKSYLEGRFGGVPIFEI